MVGKNPSPSPTTLVRLTPENIEWLKQFKAGEKDTLNGAFDTVRWQNDIQKSALEGEIMEQGSSSYKTEHGADVRVLERKPESVFNPETGDSMEIKKKVVMLRFPYRGEIHHTTAICTTVAKYPGFNWSLEPLVALADLLAQDLTWREIDIELFKRYSDQGYHEGHEHYISDEFKEYDCQAKRKFENLRKNGFLDDVWDRKRWIPDHVANAIALKAFRDSKRSNVMKIAEPVAEERPGPVQLTPEQEKQKREEYRKRLGF